MQYSIEIRDNNGKTITFGKNESTYIISVQIMVDTVKENPKSHDNNILNRVEIKGQINPSTNKQCKDLMEWALLRNVPAVNRTVKINATDPKGGDIRTFTLNNMFVEDYSEQFFNPDPNKGENDVDALFFLKLIQDDTDSNDPGKVEHGTDIAVND